MRGIFFGRIFFLGGITATDQVKKIYIADPYISYFDFKMRKWIVGVCLLLKRKNELEMSFFAYYY